MNIHLDLLSCDFCVWLCQNPKCAYQNFNFIKYVFTQFFFLILFSFVNSKHLYPFNFVWGFFVHIQFHYSVFHIHTLFVCLCVITAYISYLLNQLYYLNFLFLYKNMTDDHPVQLCFPFFYIYAQTIKPAIHHS